MRDVRYTPPYLLSPISYLAAAGRAAPPARSTRSTRLKGLCLSAPLPLRVKIPAGKACGWISRAKAAKLQSPRWKDERVGRKCA